MAKVFFVPTLLLLLIQTYLVVQCYAEENQEPPELDLSAENVCIEQVNKTNTLNITYIQQKDVRVYTWCVRIPPRCPKFVTKLVTKWRTENVTRVVNKPHCCKGFKHDGEGHCQAICKVPCGTHGTCVQPDICECEPGFSGELCDVVGCPGGNWGPNCGHTCPCLNGGRCEPHTGRCMCPPGFTGVHCQEKCSGNSYGLECSQECTCGLAQRCHHVTGECLPCQPGTFGVGCANQCQCSHNGTAVCLSSNGQCYCKPNYYGNKCEQHCPFGYLDEVCHKSPIPGSICLCTSDQMECDEKVGCVCRNDGDCEGGQRLLLDLAAALPASSPDVTEAGLSHSGTVAVVIAVLILAIVTATLIVVYYRRRMKRLQKDLNNRSVYYVENSILDPGRHHHDLVVTNGDPLQDDNDDHVAPGAQALPNNAAIATTVRLEKNVNIDRFKLGTTGAEDNDEEAAAAADQCGGCAEESAFEEETMVKLPVDVNVFCEDESPSKSKNNFLLDNNRKINKANVDLVFHRNDLRQSSATNETNEIEEDNDDDDQVEDEVTIAKMTTYLHDHTR